jgi:cation diffusion facilitator CzcD-associated flavoprotein CzcO
MTVNTELHDVLIIGAGLSGINAAHILRQELPNRKLTIVEARSVIGGTWSFFRYPGFRSDSPMTSFGLDWYPWKHNHLMGRGYEITKHLEEAASADGIMEHIRFQHKVAGCEWTSEERVWTLLIDAGGQRKTFKANFVLACTGYYAYDKAMETTIPGIEQFAGQVVHPQWWPEDLDYADKNVVVVGSGATAVTIIPSLAQKAAHLTMLQRSPSYVASQPTQSTVRKFYPGRASRALVVLDLLVEGCSV